jgi:hypothetical protein
MNTPDEQDPFAYDERLRAHFDEAARATPPPSGRIWENLQPHLQPQAFAPAPRRASWLTGAAGMIVGMLLMWAFLGTSPLTVQAPSLLTPVSASHQPQAPVETSGAPVETSGAPVETSGAPVETSGVPVETSGVPVETSGAPVETSGAPVETSGTPVAMSGALGSNTHESVIPTVLLPLVDTEHTQAQLGADTTRTTRERRRDALLMQRAALVRLQLRTDSLLLALAPATETTAVAVVDSTPVAKPKNRWSVLLTAAPERNFFGLNAPATDTLAAVRRNQEQGRVGYNAALMAEYRLSNRWSVGAGIGTSAYGGELRLTDRRTKVVRTDTTVTLVQNTHDSTIMTPTWSIKVVDELRLSPVVNFNNQIIGYDSVYVQRNDTVWTYFTTVTTVTTISRQTTPKIVTHDEVRSQVLRPNYRFLTLPVLVRYRLGRAEDWMSSPTAPRWWADVSVGAQLQWFMGGTQLVTTDGRTYATERIGRANGPFRPFNYALTSSVAVNYALTQRLSASLAPTVRYQAQSIYKPTTQLTQRPLATGVQLGLRYAF